ncbi:hypothetical protein FRC11_005135 [Ceratobasidium sp. 423]|nr:hypothetical protein FRC11_005135 [Ceratobasidium sp. 423]
MSSSSSKRKTASGGYVDSSDDEYDEENALRQIPLGQSTNKRPKSSSSSALPPVYVKPTFPRFQFPGSDSSIKSFSGCATSALEPATSSQATGSMGPDMPTPMHPASFVNREATSARNPQTSDTVRLNEATGTKLHQAQTDNIRIRSNIAIERQLNLLTASIEEGKKQEEERYMDISNKLEQVLATIHRIENSASSTASNGPAVPAPGTSTVNMEAPNPKPTPELASIVSRVVKTWKERSGKKGGPHENGVKEHARVAFYHMQKITAARLIRPYFEDEHGEPDTLPAFALDPTTGYCQPYPHWKAPFTKQVPWIPTYIKRFRATIPKDNSDLSQILRDLTDEQIVILLHDGPWRTAVLKWSEMRKTPEEIEGMRSQARRYKRIERKTAVRKSYIVKIPSLQGDIWEHLGHSGFMSGEESDSEGGLTTMRPSYRGTLVNNIYGAIDVAEGKRVRARLGPNARIPTRRVSVVKCPIPQLDRSKDDKAAPILIAFCSLSKGWRDANPDELQRSAHLIDFNVTIKPSIDDFLSEHPTDHELDEQHPGSHAVEGENGLDVNDPGTAPRNPYGGGGVADSDIDPQLLWGENQSQADIVVPAAKGVSQSFYRFKKNSNGTGATEGDAYDPDTPYPETGEAGSSSHRMPPPPTLDEQRSNLNLDQLDLHSWEMVGPAPKKRGRPRKETTNVEVVKRKTRARASEAEQSGEHNGEVTQVRKRGPGRPLGSKNKK